MRCALFVSFLCGFSATEMGKNPIRKVVTLMQNMQAEIEAEGEKEKELHEKFMCYCKSTDASLTKANADAIAKIDELGSKVKAETAEKSQITQELADHKKDREAAKADLDEATSLREKESSEFAALKADSDTNIASMAAAIPAIEKGMSGAALLQVPRCRKLKQIISAATNLDAMDQRDVLSFLEGGSDSSDYSPGAGQILGILKQMKDEFEANAKEALETEETAKAGFAELKSSKEKEIEVATESIESKMGRSGELAVSIVQTKNGLEDSTDEAADTEKALSSLKKQCAAKEKEYAAASKDRADEMAALSAAIGVLNDDDALDVFKKAVPASMIQEGATAFLQKSSHKADRAIKAHAILASAAAKANSPQLNLMLMSLKSKIRLGTTSGAHKFEEIVKMIDDMVVLLGKQQDEDDKMKEWCRVELDKAEDEEAAGKTEVSKLEASLEEVTDSIATLGEEISLLQKSIEELDYTVAQATVQRKEEHAQFQQTVQMQEAAIALITKAKGKLEKFYKPALVQKPRPVPKVQVTEVQDDDDQAFSFVQVKAHAWSLEDAMDTDSTADSTTTQTHQRSAKSGGVMALMDSIIHDTEMAMKDSEFAEKESQDDYAEVMGDAQTNRAADSKSMTDKAASKADLEAKLVTEKEAHAGATNALLGAGKLIADLHGQCDFIIENYDLRKDARASESDSLKNAKAVLSGASF